MRLCGHIWHRTQHEKGESVDGSKWGSSKAGVRTIAVTNDDDLICSHVTVLAATIHLHTSVPVSGSGRRGFDGLPQTGDSREPRIRRYEHSFTHSSPSSTSFAWQQLTASSFVPFPSILSFLSVHNRKSWPGTTASQILSRNRKKVLFWFRSLVWLIGSSPVTQTLISISLTFQTVFYSFWSSLWNSILFLCFKSLTRMYPCLSASDDEGIAESGIWSTATNGLHSCQ
jgi:hypothetical protein